MIVILDDRVRFVGPMPEGVVAVESIAKLTEIRALEDVFFVFIHASCPGAVVERERLRVGGCPVVDFSGGVGTVDYGELQGRLAECAVVIDRLHDEGSTPEELERAVHDVVKGYSTQQRTLASKLRRALGLLAGMELRILRESAPPDGEELAKLKAEVSAAAQLVSAAGPFAKVCTRGCSSERIEASRALSCLVRELAGVEATGDRLHVACAAAYKEVAELVDRLLYCARDF